MTVYTTKTIVATITGTNGDFVAAFDSYNIGNDGEHLKTKLDIVLPTAWNVFIATTPASFISVEYKNKKGRCGRSADIAVPALITTHISYEIPRDALYAPETEFWFSVYQDIDGTESRITKTAIVKCNVAEGHKAGTVPDPFGHDVIQQLADVDAANYAALDLAKLDKNFTASTNEATLLSTDIIPINKIAGTLKKSTLQTLSTWLADTTTHVFSTVSQNIRGAINELKAEIVNLNYTGSTHDALVTGALIDSEGVNFGVGGLATYLDGRLDKGEQQRFAKYIEPTGGTTIGANDSDMINAAIVGYDIVVFKKGNYYIDAAYIGVGSKHIAVLANKTLIFQEGAILNAIPNSSDVYNILAIGGDNVTIINPTCIGERTEHIGITGEFGFGINIGGWDNVKIYNPVCKDCWGDGIWFAGATNLLIENAYCDNNRRQGITVGHGKNIRIINPVCVNTNGTAPQCGIDIEPDYDTQFLDNIVIINPITKNNVGGGININIQKLLNSVQKITIDIINHKDEGSGHSIMVAPLDAGNANTLTGKISIETTGVLNAQSGIYIQDYSSINTPMIEFIHPCIIDCNTESQSALYGSGIVFMRLAGHPYTGVMGNVSFINPVIKDTRSSPLIARGFYITDDKSVGGDNIIIKDPIFSGILPELMVDIQMNGVSIYDIYKTIIKNVTSTLNFYDNIFISKFTNIGATGFMVIGIVDLTHCIINGTITVENRVASGIWFAPKATDIMYPLTTDANHFITSSDIGAKVTLRRISTTEYIVEEMIGTWTVGP